MSNFEIRESGGYFGRLEGKLYSELFGCKIPFLTSKNCGEEYARRCAEFFEGLSLSDDALNRVLSAAGEYLVDFFDECSDEFDFITEDLSEITAETVVEISEPVSLVFERSGLLSDEDCPPAFSLKMRLKELPDEIFEIAMREDYPVYAGEFSGVSPWNERLLKKKHNYIL